MDPIVLKEKFRPIFYPRSIAVVGAASDDRKFGTRYLRALLIAGYPGNLYAVNPNETGVLGLPTYATVRDIPEPVEYVIMAVPKRLAPAIFDDCAARGVKVIQMFTAGFRETGREEDRRLEDELVRKATQGGFHIVGPNCIGVYSPAHRMPYGMGATLGEAGTVGFISQSGGHAGKMVDTGFSRGIRFSKVVSFGNGADLDSVDYLEYLGVDDETHVIGAYLEGVRQGQRFLRLLREICPRKPVVIWKGGRTPSGAQVASSHTGSLATPDALWRAALRQAGALGVESLEELADTLLAFQELGQVKGNRVAVVAGITGGGGGDSVFATDAFISQGLQVLPLGPDTRAQLQEMLPPAGAIVRNPVDMGGSGGNLQTFLRVLALVAADAQTDILVLSENVPGLLRDLSWESINALNAQLLRFKEGQPKPLVVVSPPGEADAERREIEKKLSEGGIPVFPTMERAARALGNLVLYQSYRQERS